MWAKNRLKIIGIFGFFLIVFEGNTQQITLYNIRITYKDKRKPTWGVLYDIQDDKPRLIPFSRELKVDILNNKAMKPIAIDFDTSMIKLVTINKYRNVFRSTLGVMVLTFATGMTLGYMEGDKNIKNHMFSFNDKVERGVFIGAVLSYISLYSFLPIAAIKNERIRSGRFYKINEILAPYTLINQTKAYIEAKE